MAVEGAAARGGDYLAPRLIADNAAPNNVLCRTIKRHMWEEHERDWKAGDWRI